KEEAADRMLPIALAAQQIDSEQAASVVEFGLVLETWRTVSGSQILGLNQPRLGDHPANPLHREHDALDLVEHGAGKGDVVAGVRVPQPVEPAEPSCSERLVDRGEMRKPGKTPGQRLGVVSEPRSERVVDQARVRGPAAMVDEPRDRVHTELANKRQTLVGPTPVEVGRALANGP